MFKEYDTRYNVLRLELIEDCVSRMRLGASAAEFGCGVGAITPILLRQAERVTGFDFDPEAVQAAREANQGANATFVQHDLNQPIPPEFGQAFDSVIALEVIEHLDSPETFLDEIVKCLRPGGTLLLSTPNLSSPEGLVGKIWAWHEKRRFDAWDYTHKNLFTSRALLRLMKKKSFVPLRIVGLHYDTGVLPLLRFRIRLPLKKAAFWPLNRFGFNLIVTAEYRPPASAWGETSMRPDTDHSRKRVTTVQREHGCR